jgi:dihydroorotate dehydrogenase
MDGVIATNTTLRRDAAGGFVPERYTDCQGGLSGAPLRSLATAMIQRIHARTGPRLPIIGMGGVASAEDALEKIRAGATLVQLYTGLIYGGPGLPARIKRGLVSALERAGADRMAALTGLQ